MNKQTTNAIKSLVLAAVLSIVPACQKAAVNTNGANTNTVETNSNVTKNTVPPVSENNSNTVAPVSDDNADSKSETKSGGKLAQRIVGKWEGKSPDGKDIGLDFKADNTVYAIGEGADEKPAKYKVIDEENVELITPQEKPQTLKLIVKGDKMTITGEGGKIELTKVN